MRRHRKLFPAAAVTLPLALLAVVLAIVWAAPFREAPSAHAVDGASLTMNKTCSPEAAVGGLVQYVFTITNTGAETLNRVSVIDDPNLGDITSSFPATLNPSDSAQATKFYVVQESDARPLTNVVTAIYQTGTGVQVEAADDCTVQVPHLTITKTATFNPDGTTTFTFNLTNDGTTPLRRFVVTDSELGDITTHFPFELAVGETATAQITVPGQICQNTVTAVYQSVPRSTTVTATAECGQDQLSFLEVRQLNPDGTLFDAAPVTFHICSGDVVAQGCDPASATFELSTGNPSGLIPLAPGTYTVCVVEPAGFVVDPPACKTADVPAGGTAAVTFVTRPEGGNEGCTPGFWRNHLESWAATGFSPGDDFDTTFGVDLFDPDITLEQAVNARGGGVKKLARHGTAALLSAAHPGVDYPLTVAEVIALVQAGDADTLAAANELGCPLS